MPRKKQFDESFVLHQIMDHFWRKGYHATTMDELSELTSLTKTSLYNAFGGKKALFIKTVDCYCNEAIRSGMSGMRPGRSVSENLREMLLNFIFDENQQQLNNGCLLVNSVLELAASDAELHGYISKKLIEFNQTIIAYLQIEQASGRLGQVLTAKQLGDYFITVLQGLRVQVRIESNSQNLIEVIDTSLLLIQQQEKHDGT